MSAKTPWRPVFNEMMERIRKGEAKWIITWKLDRLSRNPIDSGMLQYMLQTGELELIITSDRHYTVIDAGLLFSVESWIWNQFILDLKKNVIRGMDYKTNLGIFCGMAPEWYLNNKADRTITIDPERFDMVRKMWEMFMSWNYTIKQIMAIANDEWWFRRRWTAKRPPAKLKRSGLYKMFNNVFYTGDFKWKGQIKKWTHQPMVSYEEFYRVQEMLWEKGLYMLGKSREFAFTWFIKCWECGSAITAIEKHRTIKATWEHKVYVYYNCTKRRQGCENCSQRPIKLEDLERQIDEILSSVEIIPEFKEWWLKALKDDFQNDMKLKESIQKNLQSSLDASERKLKNLTEALISELIDKDEYAINKRQLMIEIKRYREKINKLAAEKDNSLDETQEVFDFIIQARSQFNHWSLQTKKEIVRSLGLNRSLKDWKLHWIVFPRFQPIQEFTRGNKLKKAPLELLKNSVSSGTTDAKNTISHKWYATVYAVRRAILEHWEKIYLPDFTKNK